MSDKIKIVIADDRRLIRDSLRVVLSREKNIQIVGEATSGPETLDVIGDLKPDVLLIDYFMPGVDGVEAIPPVIEKSPNTKILMLTLRMDEAVIFEALKAGAKGYISKNASISDLVKAIQTVHEGELWVERKMISTFFEQGGAGRKDQGDTPKDGLTEREQEVLMCLTSGTTNKEIAAALSISEKTVKSHLNSIFRKLHVSRRLEAILYAINKGLT
jgi:NarL family two-component system response regulator LiaR